MKQVNVLQGDLKAAMIKMAIPLFFLNLLNSLYGIVDTYFVGKIGELAVGAISLTQPILWCALSVANGLSAGAIAIVSTYVGAKNQKRASHYATEVIYFGIFFAIVLSIATYSLCHPILSYLKAPSEIYQDAYDYLKILSFDYIGLFFITLYMAIRQACGDSKSGVIMSACASVLNVILDPIFIFLFHLDVKGAAIATVLSKIIVLPFLLYSLHRQDKDVYISFKQFHFNIKDGIHIMKLSIPSSFGQFLEALGFVIMNKYIVFYGATAISAYGIGERLTNLYNIPIISFHNILPTFIGQNLGAKNEKRARDSFKMTLLLCCIVSLILLCFGTIFMSQSIHFFIPSASAQLVEITSTFVFFSLVMGIPVSWYFALASVFNGSGHTMISFILSITRLWGTRIPFIILFFKYTNFGINGIWISMLLSNIVVSLIAQTLYFVYPWYKSKAIENNT